MGIEGAYCIGMYMTGHSRQPSSEITICRLSLRASGRLVHLLPWTLKLHMHIFKIQWGSSSSFIPPTLKSTTLLTCTISLCSPCFHKSLGKVRSVLAGFARGNQCAAYANRSKAKLEDVTRILSELKADFDAAKLSTQRTLAVVNPSL
jgi:hypothetical protein